MNKIVYISKEGCDVFPHLSVHKIIKEDTNTYYTQTDRFPKKWGTELEVVGYTEGLRLHKSRFFNKLNLTWNEFRRLGYYHDGSKTNYFTTEEYLEFEKYSSDNNLKIF